jgi:hypothetical protein
VIADNTRVWTPRCRQAVEQGREHPRVIGGRPVHPLGRHLHPAVDVPGAEHDRRLDPELVDILDLTRDRLDAHSVDPVLLAPEQRLARELQQYTLEGCGTLPGRGDFALDLCAHPARA